MITVPELNSRYIPVFHVNYVLADNINWWRDDALFNYPYVLFNLETFNPSQKEILGINKDLFLLTDSGGFQAIRGDVNLTWESSLQKQIDLGATKLFAFDKPPVKRTVEGQNIFEGIELDKYKKQVEENLDVAIQQSNWLKIHYPERVKDFCYVLHASSKELLDYNIKLIEDKLGSFDKYKEYFGGVCYAIKKSDYIFFTTCAAHAKKWFKDNGMYIHFLGVGSSNKMMILVYYGIDTFDSSNALRGAIAWSVSHPVMTYELLEFPRDEEGIKYPFTKQFCLCPICQNIDYKKMLETKRTKVGRWFVAHNLWKILHLNVLLDSLEKNLYTNFIRSNFRINNDIKQSLDYMDAIDKDGLETAYDKFKHYQKKDEVLQGRLF